MHVAARTYCFILKLFSCVTYVAVCIRYNEMYIHCRCTCGRCRPMDTEQESVCCREIDQVANHAPEGAKCITSHPGFEHICLNIHALQVAYYTLMEDRPSLADAPDIHTYVL